MRLATLIAILALAALLAACGSSSSEESSSDTTSAPKASTGPAGATARACPLEAGGIEALRATALSCGEAQRVAIAWRHDADCSTAPGASHGACTVRSYRCIATATGRGLSVGCARPGRSIAFRVRRG
jgi:ABC-type Fe3+-hydroxamate transport system substrate-binding protein